MQLKDSSPRKSSRSETWNEPKKWRTHRGNAGKLKPRLCQRLPGRPSRHVIEWNDVANVKAGRLSGAQEFTLAKLYLHLSRKKKKKKKASKSGLIWKRQSWLASSCQTAQCWWHLNGVWHDISAFCCLQIWFSLQRCDSIFETKQVRAANLAKFETRGHNQCQVSPYPRIQCQFRGLSQDLFLRFLFDPVPLPRPSPLSFSYLCPLTARRGGCETTTVCSISTCQYYAFRKMDSK